MIQSFVVYSLLLCVILFSGWAYQSKKYKEVNLSNPYIFLIIIFYTFICGMRYDVGSDYLTYLDTYLDLRTYGRSVFELSQESGWIWGMKQFALRGWHYSLFFSLVAFIQIYLIILSIKKFPQLLVYFLFVFLCNNWFSHYQNVLRQTITISVFLVLVMRSSHMRFRWYCLVCVMCFFIHRTSVIMLVLYPFLKCRMDKFINNALFTIIFLICSIIGLRINLLDVLIKIPTFGDVLIAADYASYMTGDKLDTGLNGSLGFGYFLKILINSIAILSYNKYQKKWSKRIPNLSSIFFIYFLGTCINALSPIGLLTRPNWYLLILQIPIFSLTIKYFFHTTKSLSPGMILQKHVYAYALISAMLMSFYTTNVLKPEGSNMEYHFWWENIKSYNI